MENLEEVKPKQRSARQREFEKEFKARKVDPVGFAIYGDDFKHFHKIGEIKDLIPAFKDSYYHTKREKPNATIKEILGDFNNNVCAPTGRKFYPYLNYVRIWRKKWDLDLMQQITEKDLVILEKKNVYQLIKTRNDERKLVLGQAGDEELEAGVRTLGGELLNDAVQMLRDDQELEEIYESDELIKRRNYIVNVFAHATKLVHGKAALMLKASEEKRNTAGFLMQLLAKAASGKMSDDELALLGDSYSDKKELVVNNNEQS